MAMNKDEFLKQQELKKVRAGRTATPVYKNSNDEAASLYHAAEMGTLLHLQAEEQEIKAAGTHENVVWAVQQYNGTHPLAADRINLLGDVLNDPKRLNVPVSVVLKDLQGNVLHEKSKSFFFAGPVRRVTTSVSKTIDTDTQLTWLKFVTAFSHKAELEISDNPKNGTPLGAWSQNVPVLTEYEAQTFVQVMQYPLVRGVLRETRNTTADLDAYERTRYQLFAEQLRKRISILEVTIITENAKAGMVMGGGAAPVIKPLEDELSQLKNLALVADAMVEALGVTKNEPNTAKPISVANNELATGLAGDELETANAAIKVIERGKDIVAERKIQNTADHFERGKSAYNKRTGNSLTNNAEIENELQSMRGRIDEKELTKLTSGNSTISTNLAVAIKEYTDAVKQNAQPETPRINAVVQRNITQAANTASGNKARVATEIEKKITVVDKEIAKAETTLAAKKVELTAAKQEDSQNKPIADNVYVGHLLGTQLPSIIDAAIKAQADAGEGDDAESAKKVTEEVTAKMIALATNLNQSQLANFIDANIKLLTLNATTREEVKNSLGQHLIPILAIRLKTQQLGDAAAKVSLIFDCAIAAGARIQALDDNAAAVKKAKIDTANSIARELGDEKLAVGIINNIQNGVSDDVIKARIVAGQAIGQGAAEIARIKEHVAYCAYQAAVAKASEAGSDAAAIKTVAINTAGKTARAFENDGYATPTIEALQALQTPSNTDAIIAAMQSHYNNAKQQTQKAFQLDLARRLLLDGREPTPEQRKYIEEYILDRAYEAAFARAGKSGPEDQTKWTAVRDAAVKAAQAAARSFGNEADANTIMMPLLPAGDPDSSAATVIALGAQKEFLRIGAPPDAVTQLQLSQKKAYIASCMHEAAKEILVKQPNVSTAVINQVALNAGKIAGKILTETNNYADQLNNSIADKLDRAEAIKVLSDAVNKQEKLVVIKETNVPLKNYFLVLDYTLNYTQEVARKVKLEIVPTDTQDAQRAEAQAQVDLRNKDLLKTAIKSSLPIIANDIGFGTNTSPIPREISTLFDDVWNGKNADDACKLLQNWADYMRKLGAAQEGLPKSNMLPVEDLIAYCALDAALKVEPTAIPEDTAAEQRVAVQARVDLENARKTNAKVTEIAQATAVFVAGEGNERHADNFLKVINANAKTPAEAMAPIKKYADEAAAKADTAAKQAALNITKKAATDATPTPLTDDFTPSNDAAITAPRQKRAEVAVKEAEKAVELKNREKAMLEAARDAADTKAADAFSNIDEVTKAAQDAATKSASKREDDAKQRLIALDKEKGEVYDIRAANAQHPMRDVYLMKQTEYNEEQAKIALAAKRLAEAKQLKLIDKDATALTFAWKPSQPHFTENTKDGKRALFQYDSALDDVPEPADRLRPPLMIEYKVRKATTTAKAAYISTVKGGEIDPKTGLPRLPQQMFEFQKKMVEDLNKDLADTKFKLSNTLSIKFVLEQQKVTHEDGTQETIHWINVKVVYPSGSTRNPDDETNNGREANEVRAQFMKMSSDYYAKAGYHVLKGETDPGIGVGAEIRKGVNSTTFSIGPEPKQLNKSPLPPPKLN